eukprot:TRINITY_DN8045_c4_g2_i1.p1 TRINITY_DN8045_c4_g2~~TRINITY_DN8045_c4_g2_i1.p1  ORF type:complete len:1457 (+),score=437.17 TRINITY_DN8045_c4_g2_i1:110-4372(+)
MRGLLPGLLLAAAHRVAASSECSVQGVPLSGCAGAASCASAAAVLSALADAAPLSQEDVNRVCLSRAECLQPLYLGGHLQVNPDQFCLRSNLSCAVAPPRGSRGECAPMQVATGRTCCDDPDGELSARGTDCFAVARDVGEHCYMDVALRLTEMALCPLAGAQQRQVLDLCPKRCHHTMAPGCECPKAYDVGCPGLHCLVPDAEKYDWDPECSDCEVWGAQLECSEYKSRRVPLLIALIALMSALVIYGAERFIRRAKTAEQRDRARRFSAADVPRGGPKLLRCYALYRQKFDRACYNFGWALVSNRGPFFICVVSAMGLLTVFGLPLAEMDKNPTSSEWAPQGSALQRQLDFYNKWNSRTAKIPYFMLMVGPADPSDTALRKKYVDATWRLLNELRTVGVEVKRSDGGTMELNYEDFCDRLPENPVFDRIYPGEKPCTHPGALDCFYEGAWEIEDTSGVGWPSPPSSEIVGLDTAVVVLNGIFGEGSSVLDDYRDRPSYKNLTDDQIRRIFSDFKKEHGGCQHWFIGRSLRRANAIGGLTESPATACPLDSAQQTELTHARFLVTLALQNPVDTAYMSRKRLRSVLVNDLDNAHERWQDRVQDFLEQADADETKYPGTRVSVVFSDFYDDVVKELSNAQFVFIIAGYALMSIVIAWEASLNHPLNNLAVVAAIYFVFIMIISTCAAYGLFALTGLKYNHLMLQVLPFLAVGLGVDDMFILLHYFRHVPKVGLSSQEIAAELMLGAGRSVTLTSLTNCVTFFGGTAIAIPALRNYLVLAGTIVTFNYISSVVCLPLMLAWWVERQRLDVPESQQRASESRAAAAAAADPVQHAVGAHFGPIIRRTPVQVGLVAIWMALLTVCVAALFTFAPIVVDFKITDLAPRGTYLSQSVGDFQDNVYNQVYRHEWLVEGGDGSGHGETGQGVDISEPSVQQDLQATAASIAQTAEINDPGQTHWLRRFYEFVEGKNASLVHKTNYRTGEPVQTACSSKCLAANGGNRAPCEAEGECGLYVMGHHWWVPKEAFWDMYHTWRHPIQGGIDGLAAFAQGTWSFGYKYGPERMLPQPGCREPNCNDTNAIILSKSGYTVDSRCIRSSGDWQSHTDRFRGLISAHLGEWAYPRPTDRYFDTELFEATTRFFWMTLAISACGVLVAGIVIPLSPRGAVLIALSGLAGALELVGMLMMAGVSFTTTIAVSVIMSVGLSVDPVVHAVSAYEHADAESRSDRVAHAIRYSTVPILKGGVSTMISFVMMGFSQFPYVVKYSFLPLIISIAISIVHGTLFIPALLGLVGSKGRPRESGTEEDGSVGKHVQTLSVTPTPCNPLVVSPKRDEVREPPGSDAGSNFDAEEAVVIPDEDSRSGHAEIHSEENTGHAKVHTEECTDLLQELTPMGTAAGEDEEAERRPGAVAEKDAPESATLG